MMFLFNLIVTSVLLFSNSALSATYAQLREDIVAGSRQLGEKCVLDIHCATRYSHCSNTCQCRMGYEKIDSECVATIGAYCDSDSECSETLPYSECVESSCRCSQDYIPYTKKQCLKPSRYNEECKVTEQCTKYLGPMGMCRPSQNYSISTCQCQIRYHQLLNGTCHRDRGFGEQCVNHDECHSEENTLIVCQNNFCGCPDGYTLDDGRICKGAATAIAQTILMVLLMSILSNIL